MQERFQILKMPSSVIFGGPAGTIEASGLCEYRQLFVRAQELLYGLQEAGEAVAVTLFNALVINGLPMSYESFVMQKNFKLATSFKKLGKRLKNFQECREQAKGTKLISDISKHFKMDPQRKLFCV